VEGWRRCASLSKPRATGAAARFLEPFVSSPQAAVAAACASLEKRLQAEMSAQASCNLGAPGACLMASDGL